MGARTEYGGHPAPFVQAVDQIKRADARPEIILDEMPAPQRIAPHAFAVSGDVIVGDAEIATGRFILLHDPAGSEAWDGYFRCVTFAKADIESDMATDPLVTEVGWSWLVDALDARGAHHHAEGGSITVVRTDGFGAMAEESGTSQIEVRASWTPDSELTGHAEGWMQLLCAIAGLPPLSPGVIPLRRSRA